MIKQSVSCNLSTQNSVFKENPQISVSNFSNNVGSTCSVTPSTQKFGLIMSTILNNASSPTQTHHTLGTAISQTPTTTHPLLPPTQLLPTQTTTNSPSVASTVQLFDSLGNPSQTQTRKTPHTTQLDRMEAILSSVLQEVKAVQLNTSQHAEAINNNSTTLANHSTSLAALLDTQSKLYN